MFEVFGKAESLFPSHPQKPSQRFHEPVEMERLRDHAEEAVVAIGVHEDVVDVAGGEKRFDGGELALKAGHAFLAPHAAAHVEIDENEIEGRAEIAGAAPGIDGFLAVAGTVNIETEAP